MYMFNAHIVILTSDTDCDGTSYGAHRVSVPAHRVAEFVASPHKAMAHARASEQMSSYYDGADDVMTMAQFRATFFAGMDEWDRDYFHREGYTSKHEHPNWNPWVYDDSLGTIYDHSMED